MSCFADDINVEILRQWRVYTSHTEAVSTHHCIEFVLAQFVLAADFDTVLRVVILVLVMRSFDAHGSLRARLASGVTAVTNRTIETACLAPEGAPGA
jgi:hypothetical protein